MDEQEVKVLEEPAVTDELLTSELLTNEFLEPPPDEISGKQQIGTRLGAILGKLLPAVLGCVSVMFFSVTAVAVAADAGIDGRYVTRMMLGELVGGINNVSVVQSDIQLSTIGGETTDQYITPSAPVDISLLPPPSSYTIALTNETPYTPDMNEIQSAPRVIPTLDALYSVFGNDAPIVLILHTHGSEAYAAHADTDYRTSDKSENVTAVGKVISERLNAAGINTIHCDTLFDAEDFNLAYYNASLKIRETVAANPSVSYIIDVHRDSVASPDGTYLPLTATLDDRSAAQLMFVVGTDHGGSGHTGWQDNLSLAARLQCDMHDSYPDLMRSINLRSASFNEQYTKGSLLLEVGSCANTLEEAKISAEIFADALIREIIGS